MQIYYEIAAGCVVGLVFVLTLYKCYLERHSFLNSSWMKFFRGFFKSLSLITAKEIQIEVIDLYRVSLENVETSLKSELNCLTKINNLKNKIKECGNDEKPLLESSLEFAEKYYSNKTSFSELSRNTLSHNLKIKETIIKLVSKLKNLLEESTGDVKQDDFDKFLKIGRMSKDLQDIYTKLNSNIELSNILGEELNSFKINLKIKTTNLEDAIKHGIKQDSFSEDKKIAEKNVEESEKKLRELLSNIELEFKSADEFIVSSLNDQDTTMIFNDVNPVSDIENAIGLTTIKIALEKSAGSGLLSAYQSLLKIETHVNDHLPTVKYHVENSNSVLELSNFDTSILFTSLLGLVENKNDAKVYNGIFPVIDKNRTENARMLAIKHNIDFKIEGGNNTDDIAIDIETLNNSYDTLIINTWKTYSHYKRNLDKFAPLINKQIILTCTSGSFESENDNTYKQKKFGKGTLEHFPENFDHSKTGTWLAIEDFLNENSNWVICQRYFNGYGITVLKKLNKQKTFLKKIIS